MLCRGPYDVPWSRKKTPGKYLLRAVERCTLPAQGRPGAHRLHLAWRGAQSEAGSFPAGSALSTVKGDYHAICAYRSA